ncbi:MAG: NFACT family protein [Ruminococcus bromii]|nr:NFACT family protein [Ruminococcus bromii]MCI7211147.1 NFACT family protein [Ruminococcus bromii]MDD6434635.1 NFACT RNA binding domain-containing protein [Ruminococcus bromii]MDY4085209.1 NFACT RNA binding domain-containing protein [Ruminococcus bromii]
MALDGIFLHHIKNEIKNEALYARVSQIYQPNRDELVIVLRTHDGSKKLLLSSRANSPRVNFCVKTPENPAQPPMFCMLLRKRIGGGKLIDVRQAECDRILFLDFECINELGDTETLTIVCEIMGMYSNIIVINRETEIIIDSLKRVDLTMSSQRLVLPNIKYELPTPQDKLNILEATPEQIVSKLRSLDSEMPLNKALLKVIQGISPIICREIEYRVCEGATNRAEGVIADKLISELANLKTIAENCSGTPCIVYREDGRPLDNAFMLIKQYGNFAEVKTFDGFSKTLDEFYETRDSRERMRMKSQGLTKLLNNIRERTARKISKQQAELARCGEREQLRICGDLLQANLYRIERGSAFVDVENFYDEQGKTLRIKLNPAISPAANAQKYYKDYQKAKNAEIVLAKQIKKGNAEIEYIESVLDTVDRAENERELSQIREELTEQGYLKRQKGKQRQQAKLPPLEFESSDGFRIFVGRNNRQNDKLTLKTAAKNDMWLHTKDIHGSHVIIESNGREISDKAILEAAQLAAYNSKARNSDKVPVDYTLARYVSKPNGSKPGMVIYVNNKTIYVTPKQDI